MTAARLSRLGLRLGLGLLSLLLRALLLGRRRGCCRRRCLCLSLLGLCSGAFSIHSSLLGLCAGT